MKIRENGLAAYGTCGDFLWYVSNDILNKFQLVLLILSDEILKNLYVGTILDYENFKCYFCIKSLKFLFLVSIKLIIL